MDRFQEDINPHTTNDLFQDLHELHSIQNGDRLG